MKRRVVFTIMLLLALLLLPQLPRAAAAEQAVPDEFTEYNRCVSELTEGMRTEQSVAKEALTKNTVPERRLMKSALTDNTGLTQLVPRGVSMSEKPITVTNLNGTYFLLDGEKEDSSDNLAQLIEGCKDRVIVFDSVSCESLTLDGGSYIFSGTLEVLGSFDITEGTSLSLCEAYITVGGEMRLSGGSLYMEDGSVSGSVLLDYTALSVFEMSGGSLENGNGPALTILRGVARLYGGEISSSVADAVINSDSLYLGGSLSISSARYDVVSDTPISLTAGGRLFGGNIDVRLNKSFPKGEVHTVFRDAAENLTESVRLFDENDAACDIEFFDALGADRRVIGVYRPYKISYFGMNGVVREELLLRDEVPSLEFAEPTPGFVQTGWYLDEGGSVAYHPSSPIEGDMRLYAGYRLAPPTFSISGYKGVYDASAHIIDFTQLEHPCDGEGIYSFTWLDEGGDAVCEGRELRVKTALDSGIYKCKIVFSSSGYTVTVLTPDIRVEIAKQPVAPPTVAPVSYCGRVVYPDIPKSLLYSFSDVGFIDSGEYKIPVYLNDTDNYVWGSGEEYECRLAFTVLTAENYWIEEIRVENIFVGEIPDAEALSAFGAPYYMFSSSPEGEFTKAVPISAGKYYVKAFVDGCNNYTGLESAPVEFNIDAERAVALSIQSMPHRQEYSAFEQFDRSGLILSVTYNSGRVENLSEERFSIFYQSGNCLLSRHNGVIAEYMGLSVTVPVRVERIDYELPTIPLDISAVYDGKFHTLQAPVGLPMGKDGYTLGARVEGGGSGVGVYEITVSFYSESANYNIPSPITVKLRITPREVEPLWENLGFVYDGGVKLPRAYYKDVLGAVIPLSVSGGGRDAGIYTAVCSVKDENYTLTSDSCSFVIERATYDMSGAFWSTDEFIYDGEPKTVTVVGLPDGVSAFGYVGNIATEAGEYFAKVSFDYDEKNYYEPRIAEHKWIIGKGRYDMSGVSFVGGTIVYDGLMHYPSLSGGMPTGNDGSSPSYSFDKGVKNVLDGSVTVCISFTTESKNYLAPYSIFVEMSIIPAMREVTWGELELIYNGEVQFPTAYSNEFAVFVEASGINSGRHSAVAKSEDPNYSVINSTVEYVIKKRDNIWTEEPCVSDMFFGGEFKFIARAEFGEPALLVYRDFECKNEASFPLGVGSYYAQIRIDESANYNSLHSEPLAFSVIEVVPIELKCEIVNRGLRAFEKLCEGDLTVVLVYNNGDQKRVDWKDILLDYSGFDSLRAGLFRLTVRHGEFSDTVDVSVKKQIYDTSDSVWSYGDMVYDGKEKNAYISSLPEGVEVTGYIGNGNTDVGEYTVRAIVKYDEKNYEPPNLPEGKMVILPKEVTPAFDSIFYDGGLHIPSPKSELYFADCDGLCEAGVYKVTARLYDSRNYVLSNGGEAEFIILPRPLTVQIEDIDLYLFESAGDFSYRVVEGELVPGDDLFLEFVTRENEITASSGNTNYDIRIVNGRINRINRLSEDGVNAVFGATLIFAMLSLGVMIIIFKREPILGLAGAFVCKIKSRSRPFAVADIEDVLMSVDSERAEDMLTDSIARTLVRSGEVVYTRGHRRAIINIDTISANFSAGDRVDVNSLKERGLVPSDTFRVKVLARGEIDKPIKVYANDFSLTAVKMIALTGGEAIKTTTKRSE